jgi:hypothetical protein
MNSAKELAGLTGTAFDDAVEGILNDYKDLSNAERSGLLNASRNMQEDITKLSQYTEQAANQMRNMGTAVAGEYLKDKGFSSEAEAAAGAQYAAEITAGTEAWAKKMREGISQTSG